MREILAISCCRTLSGHLDLPSLYVGPGLPWHPHPRCELCVGLVQPSSKSQHFCSLGSLGELDPEHTEAIQSLGRLVEATSFNLVT